MGSPEEWSFGAHFSSDISGEVDPDVGDIDMSTLATAWDTLADSAISIGANVRLNDVRAYLIGTDGRTIGNPNILDVSSQGKTGTGATRYPPQIALCATLVADNRGPAKFGRMYLPTQMVISDTDWRLTTAQASVACTAVSTFLKTVSDAIDVPFTLTSSSCINVSSRGGPDGTKQTVDHVEVGRVLDTMRSRRRGLVEDRQKGAPIDW